MGEEVYFRDVHMQFVARAWADQYNARQVSVAEYNVLPLKGQEGGREYRWIKTFLRTNDYDAHPCKNG